MASVTPDDAMRAALDAMDRPFAWGLVDCCTSPCAAFSRLHGLNPLGPVGYRSLLGAVRFVTNRGGPENCARGIALSAGLRPCNEVSGAIGRIDGVAQHAGLTLGICIEPGLWAYKSVDDVVFADIRAAECWGGA